jgi:hypothetical protein
MPLDLNNEPDYNDDSDWFGDLPDSDSNPNPFDPLPNTIKQINDFLDNAFGDD